MATIKKTVLSLLLFSSSLFAQEDYNPLFLKIGANYAHLNLKPSGLASFSGNLGGIQASFEYKPQDFIYEGVTFLWRQGKTDGAGGLTRSILDIDTQVRLGYTATVGDKTSFTPFTGFGWRYIGQDLKGKSIPVDLNYNEVYIPVGLLSQYDINNFSIGLNGIWMPQIFPTVNIVPLDNARWVTACTLANFLLELPLTYRIDYDSWTASFELRPFFEYWQDGKTLAKSSTGVPLGLVGNTYYFGGFQFNLGAQF